MIYAYIRAYFGISIYIECCSVGASRRNTSSFQYFICTYTSRASLQLWHFVRQTIIHSIRDLVKASIHTCLSSSVRLRISRGERKKRERKTWRVVLDEQSSFSKSVEVAELYIQSLMQFQFLMHL